MGHHHDSKRKKTESLKTKVKFEVLFDKLSEFALLFDNLEDSYESGELDKFIEFAYASNPYHR